MKISDHVYLVGSGRAGCMISNIFDSHVYLLETPEGNILIDAGVGLEIDRIYENIVKEGFDPASVKHCMLTHVHSDHAGGAGLIKQATGCKVYISEKEADLLEHPDIIQLGLDIAIRDGFYPDDYVFTPCVPDVILKGGEVFSFGGVSVQAIHVPGHSFGSMCYLVIMDGRTIMFSGDVVVHGGKLMFLNCIGSVMGDMRESMPKLANLGVEELYPGHGCFVLSDGQGHIDIAIENLRHLVAPPNAL